MKKIIYIKVHKGFVEARTVGANNERQFHSNALNHPRTLAADFPEVEKTLKDAISAQPKTLFGLLKPRILVHLIPEMEGGYTDVELRFFREAAFGGGGAEIFMATHPIDPLPDSELSDLRKFL